MSIGLGKFKSRRRVSINAVSAICTSPQCFNVEKERRAYLKSEECLFLKDAMYYRGHTIRSKTLEVPTKMRNAIRSFRPSNNLINLRVFRGACNLYQEFVLPFPRTVALLEIKPNEATEAF